MPPPPLLQTLPVHPHQIEVQEFDAYALIVDLRPASEHGQDHLPGAVSAPWTPQAASSTGAGAVVLVAAEPGGELPASLLPRLAALHEDDAILLYCATGGRDATAVALALQQRGHVADVLPGGWGNYRRWAAAGVEILARVLTFVVVRSPRKTESLMVAALQGLGQQVVALSGCATDVSADSALVDALRRWDPARPVWIVATEGADEALPATLRDALRRAPTLRVQGAGAGDAPGPGGPGGRELVLTLVSSSPEAVGLALLALPAPWPDRLRPDPDQSSP